MRYVALLLRDKFANFIVNTMTIESEIQVILRLDLNNFRVYNVGIADGRDLEVRC
jgi:hypothetical protein